MLMYVKFFLFVLFNLTHCVNLLNRLNDNRGKEQFEISLKQVFVSLNVLMHENSDASLVIQGAALRYFPTTISDVITVFDPQQYR